MISQFIMNNKELKNVDFLSAYITIIELIKCKYLKMDFWKKNV